MRSNSVFWAALGGGLALSFSLSSAACAAAPVAMASASPQAASVVRIAEGTLLLQSPTISAEHVVFRYADDLWIVGRHGGEARRLTSSPGRETAPQLSPDGKLVAFSAQYQGNTDVYTLPVEGGTPTRLTWHPGGDTVLDWMPDGSGVIFSSYRDSAAPAGKAFVASLAGGTPAALELPKVSHLAVDQDASHFAYTPTRDAFGTWKRYRGGRLASVWLFDRATHDVEVVPHGLANDSFPVWLGDEVAFGSDRDGVMNLFTFMPGDKDVSQITEYTDFHIRSMDGGAGLCVFEQAGSLHVFNPKDRSVEDLVIEVKSDGLFATPRWQKAGQTVRQGDIAPNGKRAVFEMRGEIVSMPREHGDARNLTNSPGAHDRSPAWSPDGKRIAWLSDADGEYKLHLQESRGRGNVEVLDLGAGGFFRDLSWSPDGEQILFVTKTNRIAYVSVADGSLHEVAVVQGSLGEVQPRAVWSPDSKWIAFVNRNPRTLFDHIDLFDVATGVMTSVTDAFAYAEDPAFSSDGKYLYFNASTNRGSKLMGLNMNASEARDWDGSLYVCVLKADEPSPLAARSDEGYDEDGDDADEAKADDADADDADADDADADDAEEVSEASAADDESGDAAETEEAEEEPEVASVDVEGLNQRILALPTGTGRYSNLLSAGDKLLFVEYDKDFNASLCSFDFEGRKKETLREGVDGFTVSADGKSLLVSAGGGFEITGLSGKDGDRIATGNVKLFVDPNEEWPEILREAWRIERDYFYDPAMHGVDWDAMWERWSAFLPHVRHRSELNLLIGELIGELSCGHEYVSGGEFPDAPEGTSGGLLGANWAVDGGRYRIAEIFAGQNWNPRQRAPLTAPGVDAHVGDYLMAVNGRDVTGDMNLNRAFEGTAGEEVELTLASDATGTDSRSVKVEPIGSEFGLRFASWIEGNRKRVDELSGGKLAYIYMPDTGGRGMNSFDRDFYSQLDKKGLVLDERYNGGGQVADYVIETLSRDVMNFWINREGWVGYTPAAQIDGPKVMIINESAGSGGDWMPWAFQGTGVGPLVGTRTWGGLVGISGYPPLMDGGSVTAASFGIVGTNGEWAVENVGVSPDFEVIEYPGPIIAGHDPQLEKAVEVALKALETYEAQPVPSYHPPAPR